MTQFLVPLEKLLNLTKLVLAFLLLLQLQHVCHGVAKFTNVQCVSLDANFSEFTNCRLRAVKRNVNELSIKLHLLQTPLSDVSMRWQFMKKASGYRPFLYDITVDACEYMDRRHHPFLNIVFNSFGNYSNFKPKCPVNDDISLENFPFPSTALTSLPLLAGEYALFGTFSTLGTERISLKVYFKLEDF